MKCDTPEEFCDENFLNFRALRQSDNIKIQLYDILDNCNVDICRRMYKKDPNYLDHAEILEKYQKDPPEKYKSGLLRKVLSIAFYFNTAKLTSNRQAYILNYPEGTLVTLDPTSALGLQ